jgi:hypothetical protein
MSFANTNSSEVAERPPAYNSAKAKFLEVQGTVGATAKANARAALNETPGFWLGIKGIVPDLARDLADYAVGAGYAKKDFMERAGLAKKARPAANGGNGKGRGAELKIHKGDGDAHAPDGQPAHVGEAESRVMSICLDLEENETADTIVAATRAALPSLASALAGLPLASCVRIRRGLASLPGFPLAEYDGAIPAKDGIDGQFFVGMHGMTDGINLAEGAVSRNPDIFRRGGHVVRAIRGDDGGPRIEPVKAPTLAELIDANSLLRDYDKDGNPCAVKPPAWMVDGLLCRGEYPTLRRIAGVIGAPTLRPDGSILDTPGWDATTGLLHVPSCKYPAIPGSPTHEDAKKAAETIFALVEDFPFASDSHKAAWLALLLTLVAREAINGPVPIFPIVANSSGAGKTFLAMIAHAIATGLVLGMTPWPATEEEMAKVITAASLACRRCLLFDNLPNGGTLTSPVLDGAITSRQFEGRILGKSELATLPWDAVVAATGNELALGGDMLQRVVPIRLKSEDERPDARADFALGPDCDCGCHGQIVRHATNLRPELLAAALTILRAHAVEGRPGADELPMGRFPAWTRVIRAAVKWSTGIDPCDARDEADVIDQGATDREAVVIGLSKIPEIGGGLTVTRIHEIVYHDSASHQGLIDLFARWATEGDKVTPRQIGRHFTALAGKPTKLGSLERRTLDGYTRWFVRPRVDEVG